MKTIGTDGKEYIINPTRESRDTDELKVSKLHKHAREIIKKCLPYSNAYEEVTLLGCRGLGGNLVADFFLPSIPMIIEVHGEQHYKFSKFFHGSESEFKKYVINDEIKKDWAELNNIVYIELPFNKIKEWKSIINEHL